MVGVSKVQEVEKIHTLREEIIHTLKENLVMAQNHIKHQVDQGHSEHQFDERDHVFLCLQPYKTSLKYKYCKNVAPKLMVLIQFSGV
jgi:predicted RNase H-related nuclease YkuK (DUF458 family)